MIVVTGATGRLGGLVVERLLERVPPEQLGVSVRDPARAGDLAERGVRVRRGDYDDPDALATAVAGADRLLLVSAPRLGAELLAAHRAAIDAARRAGVGRVLYTSHIGSDPLSPFPPMVGHAATEAMLRDSGLAFTVLRNGFYTATAEAQARAARDAGELRLPADAPVSWTTHDDLAAGIAALLLDDDLTEPVVGLTAGEAVDLAGLAELVATATGRPVHRAVVPDEEYRAGLVAAGTPARAAAMVTGLWAASRQRRFGVVDPTLAALLGRPTATAREVVERALRTPAAGV
jgi:uncharacterized protein YbjT (DUF2867 family)